MQPSATAMQLDLFSHQPATPAAPVHHERPTSPGRCWPAATWIPASLIRSALAAPQSRIVALTLGDQSDAPICQIGAAALRTLFAHMHHTTQIRLTPTGPAVTVEMQTAGRAPNARMVICDGAWLPTTRRRASAPAAGSTTTITLITP